jgi:hypothetical protein
MEALQQALQIANQERDAAEASRIQAVAERATAVAEAAQAMVDLATARTATAAANAAVMTAAAATAGNVTFALSPALASTALLNYKSGEGIKIYGKATSPLDVLFNGESGALRLFLSKVQQRAIQFGWTAILKIKQGGTVLAPAVYDFIESYGQVTLNSIRTQAAALELANDRNAQNSSQMYTFLITSIDDGLLGKVISQRDHYTSATGFQDGPSLLKVIVTISHVDTRAQAGYIRQCLARLSITILSPEYNCNIQKLNEYVIVLEEGLTARGESSQDTMMNVQAAYMVCKDADFVRHAKDEYARWEQGATMTLKEYMASALTKYKTLRMKGVWEAPSPEQEQIIALTAAVTSLRTKATKATTSKTGDRKKDLASLGKGPRRNDGSFAWKDVAPKAGEPTKKTVKGKSYYWCTHHTTPLWTLHNPSAFPNLCRYHPKYNELETAWKNKSTIDATPGDKPEPHARDMKLADALAAIEDSDSDSELEDDEK